MFCGIDDCLEAGTRIASQMLQKWDTRRIRDGVLFNGIGNGLVWFEEQSQKGQTRAAEGGGIACSFSFFYCFHQHFQRRA